MKAGLIGYPLSHSYSSLIHSFIGDYPYEHCEVAPDGLEAFVKSREFDFYNVTIPHKVEIMKHLDFIDPDAKRVGAVNTVVDIGGVLCGYNTDVFGFEYTVSASNISVKGKKALVLGAGGAAKTAIYVLEKLGAQVCVISRRGEDNFENIEKHGDAGIIVNCTPVGMFPHMDERAVDLSVFPRLEYVFDMIYNPFRTDLMRQAQALGVGCTGGMAMLAAQAVKASELFTGKKLDKALIPYAAYKTSLKHICVTLIGMPGSGKSTVGRRVSQMLGLDFYDTDALVEKDAKMKIPEIFNSFGEEHFRALEARALSYALSRGGVIATGGGIIKSEGNRDNIKRHGPAIYLDRPLNRLSSAGRPLSQSVGVEALYKERAPLYTSLADITVKSEKTPAMTAEIAVKELEEFLKRSFGK